MCHAARRWTWTDWRLPQVFATPPARALSECRTQVYVASAAEPQRAMVLRGGHCGGGAHARRLSCQVCATPGARRSCACLTVPAPTEIFGFAGRLKVIADSFSEQGYLVVLANLMRGKHMTPAQMKEFNWEKDGARQVLGGRVCVAEGRAVQGSWASSRPSRCSPTWTACTPSSRPEARGASCPWAWSAFAGGARFLCCWVGRALTGCGSTFVGVLEAGRGRVAGASMHCLLAGC